MLRTAPIGPRGLLADRRGGQELGAADGRDVGRPSGLDSLDK